MTDRASLPDFELPATGNQRFQLSAFRGHPFVLYFYPRDNTPGCSDEGIFGVMKMKNMYGRQVRGIERSTFVIDREGRIAREWRGVKVPGHARAVLDFVRSAGL